jgi:hypothetical protein
LVALVGLAGTLALPAAAWPSHSVTEIVSTGTSGGNGASDTLYGGAASDGSHVFFTTREALTSGDTDGCPGIDPPEGCIDVYDHSGLVTTMITPAGNDPYDTGFVATTPAGGTALISTGQPISAADTDTGCIVGDTVVPCPDIYKNAAGTTTFESTGPAGGSAALYPFYDAIATDGTRVVFSTEERLVSADTDNADDVYERAGGVTTLLSTGPTGGNAELDAPFAATSQDATRVFFRTAERLVGADADSSADIYERSGGTTTLVSTAPGSGNGAFAAAFEKTTPDGSAVFLTTAEPLVAADTDSAEDVYQRSGGVTTLVSTAASGGNGSFDALFDGASDSGAHVFFRTRESLSPSDTDSKLDLYDRSGGTTTLLSTGPNGGNGAKDVYFSGASTDGSRAVFTTQESLVSADSDGKFDIYERSGSTTTLLSTGPNGGNGAFDAIYGGASEDGSRVFFETYDSLVSTDTDGFQDIYERSAGTTTLISTGPNSTSGTWSAFYAGTTDDGGRVYFLTGDSLVAADTDGRQDLYVAIANVGYPRPKGATPINVSLVPAFKPCAPASANSVHGAPLASPSCNPPSQESGYLTVGTFDSNQKPVKSIGAVQFQTVLGDTATPADEADVKLDVSITDVRNKSDLSDYAGELRARTSLRLTDKNSGGLSATVADLSYEFNVPCAATSDATVGSTCAVSTTADALAAGAIVEGKRAIWELGNVELLDGGADGDGDTSPNTIFARQGIFVP